MRYERKKYNFLAHISLLKKESQGLLHLWLIFLLNVFLDANSVNVCLSTPAKS